MNGVRSTYMRKGYLLTALAAAVLLAASSGTAWAQEPVTAVTLDKVTISSARSVGEGDTLTVTVRAEARVPAKVAADGGQASDPVAETDRPTSDSERTATVTLALTGVAGTGSTTMGESGETSQVDDGNIVTSRVVRLVFGENTGTSERTRRATGTVTVQTNQDPDAENEALSVGKDEAVSITLGGTNVTGDVAAPDPANFTVMDDETQTYVLALARTHDQTNPPVENGEIEVTLKAVPAHYEGGGTFTLHVRQDGSRAAGYSAMGADSPDSSATIGTADEMGTNSGMAADVVNTREIDITQDHKNGEGNGDGNRVTDTITLEAYAGSAGSGTMVGELDIDVLDIHGLAPASAITAVAKDEDGNEVTEVMEGGDPVYLTVTVDRGMGATQTTDEELTVDIEAADSAQVADYDLSVDRITLEEKSSGKQSNDIDVMIKLSARSDEDVGMEYLMLNLEVSGETKKGTETSTGTFSIGIVDNTMKKVEPKSEDEAYPAIMAAMEMAAGDDGLNPGESFTVMASDLFMVADGYMASYGVSVEGGAASVSASSDSITVTATAVGEAKVTVTATAKMASSSFIPEQTMSDVAKITFPVMVVEGMPEPVPALPLFGQLLLALFMMAGGARLYRRRQG